MLGKVFTADNKEYGDTFPFVTSEYVAFQTARPVYMEPDSVAYIRIRFPECTSTGAWRRGKAKKRRCFWKVLLAFFRTEQSLLAHPSYETYTVLFGELTCGCNG